MKHIYYKNDFAVEITLLNASGEVVAPPDWQWHIEFTDGRRKYICSVDKGNANVVGNTIMCYLDNHKFCCGEIGYKFVQAIPDLNYIDGFQNLITPKALPIELWEQESDNDVNIQSSVVPAYVVYDAYMTAKANGYTGTAEDFYDALIHIVDINTAEAERVEAEANRVTAEQQRVENFVAMESALTTSTSKANTATTKAEEASKRADNSATAASQATTQAMTATKRANDISADLEAKREADYWRGAKGDKGEKGDTGAKGEKGDKGDQGERGLQGVQGVKGDDGVSPTVTTSKTGKVTTIEITDANGVHTATVNDGESVDIVQSTGTSTTAVMSQKAVSDAIAVEETRAKEAEKNLDNKVTDLETNTSLVTFIKSQEAASLKYSFKAGRIYHIYADGVASSSTRNTESGTTIDDIGEINGSVIFIPTADAKYLRIGVQTPLSNTIQIECISQSVKDLFDSYEKLRQLRGIVAEIKGVFNNRITAIDAGLTTGDSFVFNGGTTDFLLGTFISPTEASYITITEDSLLIFNNKLYRTDVANRKIIPIKGMVVEIKGIFDGIQSAISAGLTTGDSYIYKSLTSIELGTFISSDKASYVTLTEQNNNDWLFILGDTLYRADVSNRTIVPIKDKTLYDELSKVSSKVDSLDGKHTILPDNHTGTSYPYNFVKGKEYSVLVKSSGNGAWMGLRTNPDGPSYQKWKTVDGVPHTFVAENDYSYLRAGLFNNPSPVEVIETGKLDKINIEIANLKTRNIISKLAYSESERITITDELDGFVFNSTEEHNIFCADFFDRLIAKFDELCSKHSNAITKYDSVSFVNESLQTPLVYPQYTKLNGQASGIYLATPSYTIPIYKIGMLTSDEMNANKVNIVLIAGLHGWEISSPFNSYVFARHLLEASTGNYAKLLQSANIYILPLLNVYGCYHGYYVNANGVNINRNYPYDGWTPIEGTVPFDSQYAGTEAGSEFETQLTMAILNKIKPQIALDMHGNGADSYYVYLSNPSYGQAFSANDLLADYTRLCQTEYPQFFGTKYNPLWNSSSLSVSTSLNGGRYLDTWIWKNICQIGGTFEVNLSIFHNNGVRDVNTYRSEFMGENAVTLNEWQLRNFISKLWNLLPQ